MNFETEEERMLKRFEALKMQVEDRKLELVFLREKNKGWNGDPNMNAKNILQEYCQKFKYSIPKYWRIKTDGSLHAQIFTVSVIGKMGSYKSEEMKFTGVGRTTKFAEIKAAEKACDKLELKYRPIEEN